jgi:hypothetical protein
MQIDSLSRGEYPLNMYKIDADAVCSSKIDDETLILNLDTGFYYTLDSVGGEIWERLMENQDEQRIVSAIADSYNADPGQIRKDFQELVAELEKEGLIQKF